MENSGNFFLLLCGHPASGGCLSEIEVGAFCLVQCFDTVGWVTGRAVKTPVPLILTGSLPPTTAGGSGLGRKGRNQLSYVHLENDN